MQHLPTELENYIYEFSGIYKDIFKSVLQQIRMIRVLRGIHSVTHCHSCGKHFHVGFHGYCYKYCNKQCWKYSSEDYFWYETEMDTTEPLTHSTYHTSYYPISKVSWPMLPFSVPCYNECILRRRTRVIFGYNDHYD